MSDLQLNSSTDRHSGDSNKHGVVMKTSNKDHNAAGGLCLQQLEQLLSAFAGRAARQQMVPLLSVAHKLFPNLPRSQIDKLQVSQLFAQLDSLLADLHDRVSATDSKQPDLHPSSAVQQVSALLCVLGFPAVQQALQRTQHVNVTQLSARLTAAQQQFTAQCTDAAAHATAAAAAVASRGSSLAQNTKRAAGTAAAASSAKRLKHQHHKPVAAAAAAAAASTDLELVQQAIPSTPVGSSKPAAATNTKQPSSSRGPGRAALKPATKPHTHDTPSAPAAAAAAGLTVDAAASAAAAREAGAPVLDLPLAVSNSRRSNRTLASAAAAAALSGPAGAAAADPTPPAAAGLSLARSAATASEPAPALQQAVSNSMRSSRTRASAAAAASPADPTAPAAAGLTLAQLRASLQADPLLVDGIQITWLRPLLRLKTLLYNPSTSESATQGWKVLEEELRHRVCEGDITAGTAADYARYMCWLLERREVVGQMGAQQLVTLQCRVDSSWEDFKQMQKDAVFDAAVQNEQEVECLEQIEPASASLGGHEEYPAGVAGAGAGAADSRFRGENAQLQMQQQRQAEAAAWRAEVAAVTPASPVSPVSRMAPPAAVGGDATAEQQQQTVVDPCTPAAAPPFSSQPAAGVPNQLCTLHGMQAQQAGAAASARAAAAVVHTRHAAGDHGNFPAAAGDLVPTAVTEGHDMQQLLSLPQTPLAAPALAEATPAKHGVKLEAEPPVEARQRPLPTPAAAAFSLADLQAAKGRGVLEPFLRMAHLQPHLYGPTFDPAAVPVVDLIRHGWPLLLAQLQQGLRESSGFSPRVRDLRMLVERASQAATWARCVEKVLKMQQLQGEFGSGAEAQQLQEQVATAKQGFVGQCNRLLEQQEVVNRLAASTAAAVDGSGGDSLQPAAAAPPADAAAARQPPMGQFREGVAAAPALPNNVRADTGGNGAARTLQQGVETDQAVAIGLEQPGSALAASGRVAAATVAAASGRVAAAAVAAAAATGGDPLHAPALGSPCALQPATEQQQTMLATIPVRVVPVGGSSAPAAPRNRHQLQQVHTAGPSGSSPKLGTPQHRQQGLLAAGEQPGSSAGGAAPGLDYCPAAASPAISPANASHTAAAGCEDAATASHSSRRRMQSTSGIMQQQGHSEGRDAQPVGVDGLQVQHDDVSASAATIVSAVPQAVPAGVKMQLPGAADWYASTSAVLPGPPAAAAAAAGAAAGAALAAASPPPVAGPAGGQQISLAAAQRQLLQLYRERVGPSLDKLLRWKGAMRAVEKLRPGDVTLDKFWHEYDFITCLAGLPDAQPADFLKAFTDLVDSILPVKQ